MNKKIFIEYDNTSLSSLCNNLYDLFLKNNYNVELLDNNLSLNEKIAILDNNPNQNVLISNKINNNPNTIEIIYPLRKSNELALLLNNKLTDLVSKYYQLRDNIDTSKDYYELLHPPINESIILKYGTNILNNANIPNLLYQGITGYLQEENIYTVKSGDSLYAIARNFNTTVDEIKRLNNLTTNNLSLGQKLIIPNTSNANQNNDNNIYTVKSGDSLYAIARNFNTTVDEIKRLNNLTTNNLSLGQKLIIK